MGRRVGREALGEGALCGVLSGAKSAVLVGEEGVFIISGPVSFKKAASPAVGLEPAIMVSSDVEEAFKDERGGRGAMSSASGGGMGRVGLPNV